MGIKIYSDILIGKNYKPLFRCSASLRKRPHLDSRLGVPFIFCYHCSSAAFLKSFLILHLDVGAQTWLGALDVPVKMVMPAPSAQSNCAVQLQRLPGAFPLQKPMLIITIFHQVIDTLSKYESKIQ